MMASGVGCSIDRPRKWRIILPIGNLLIAICLLVVGDHQYRAATSERVPDVLHEWTPPRQDYLPLAKQVAYAINFPALLLAKALVSAHHESVTASLVFLVGVVIVWYLVGLLLEGALSQSTKHKSTTIAIASTVGLLVSVLGIWFSWKGLGMDYVIPPLGALLWSGVFGAYCLWRLRKCTPYFLTGRV